MAGLTLPFISLTFLMLALTSPGTWGVAVFFVTDLTPLQSPSSTQPTSAPLPVLFTVLPDPCLYQLNGLVALPCRLLSSRNEAK